MRFKNGWASLTVGSKFTIFLCFALYLRAIFLWVQTPGELIFGMEGWFNGGFFASQDWGGYIWRGLYMEGLIFGILRYLKTKLHLTTPLQNSEEFVKNQALINLSRQVLWDWSKFAKWCTRGHACALSSPILLITILIARIESLKGPGRIICMGPYGPKTTKADDKEFY